MPYMKKISTPNNEATHDLAELEFSPVDPDEAAALDDRVYLLGVRAEFIRGI
jgi:hypothetical protein